jgi:hypothetical protein
MATKSLYLKDALAGTSDHLSLQDGGTPPGDATTTTSWDLDKVAPTVYCEMDSQAEQPSSSFGATAQPNGTINTTNGDCFRTENTLSGSWASGTWTLAFPVVAVVDGGQDGRIRIRLHRGTNQDGSGATEITSAGQDGSVVTDLDATPQTSTVSFNPGAITMTAEYLFVEVAWEITGAASKNNSDVFLRVGSAAVITTSDWTAGGQTYERRGGSNRQLRTGGAVSQDPSGC